MRRLICLLCALYAMMLFPVASAYAEHHTLIVLSKEDRTVYDMEPATGKVLNEMQFDGVPTDAVFSWDEQSLFVAVPDEGYISIINLKTFKESSRLTRPEFKRTAKTVGLVDALATTPDYRKLYVSVPGGLEAFEQQLLVVDSDYKQTPAKIALPGQDGQHMLVHGPSNKLYYALGKDDQVAVIDTLTDKVVKTIAIKGGPTDVAFNFGYEAWVTAADGSVSVIDINKDEVVKTIETGGKGPSRISIAHDLRYIAATHDDSGDVSILQPMTKDVVGTIKIGKGPLSVAFAPAGHGSYPGYRGANTLDYHYPPTNQLYIADQSTVSTVDLDAMTVTTHQTVGQDLTQAFIHYTYPDGFGDGSPREGAITRMMETDSFILYNYAMTAYDTSPIHEHREDMVGINMSHAVAKVGCWDPTCPDDSSDAARPADRRYNYSEISLGPFTGEPHGWLHQEQGITAQPKQIIIFNMKNNYYRMMNPKPKSDFAGKPGFTQNADMSRAWLWYLTLVPGKPVHFPKTDYAFVYLGGALIKETHGDKPEIVHRLFYDTEVDPTEKTVEAVSNEVRLVVVEFK